MLNPCEHCGHENRPAAKFCVNCGNPLGQAPDGQLVESSANEAILPQSNQSIDGEALPAASLLSDAPSTDPEEDLAARCESDSLDGAGKAAQQSQPAALSREATSAQLQDVQPAQQEAANDHLQVAIDVVIVASPTIEGKQQAPDDAEIDHELTDTEVGGQPFTNQLALEPTITTDTLIAGRYQVVASSTNDHGERFYQVEDHAICRSCGVNANGTDAEPYCLNCGAHLFNSSLPWPLYQLREVGPSTTTDDDHSFFVWHNLNFELVKEQERNELPDPSAGGASLFPRGVQLLVGQRSDVGVMRAGQADEDSIFTLTITGLYESISRPSVGLYLVADGMGGHGDGEIASRIAADVISAQLIQTAILPILQGQTLPDENLIWLIDDAIQSANRQVFEQARSRANDMGTTLTLALVVDGRLYVANVGDSRTYLWGRSGLRQLSQDHSYVYNLYKSDALTEEELYTHPRRNEIYRSLGMNNRLEADQFQEQLAPGDIVLLCCDGLWEMLHNDGIADVLMLNLSDPQASCDELVNRANIAGGEDNISVVVVHVMA